METLLQNMIFEQNFGYALFGNKPVSLAGYFLNPSLDAIFFNKKSFFFPVVEAWSMLEKNVLCHLQGNYILLKQVNRVKNDSTFQAIIVNKSSFLQTVTDHLDLFCELLEEKIDPKELLDEVILNQKSLWDILKGNRALYGIILGYGEKNSFAFEEEYRYFEEQHGSFDIQTTPLSPVNLPDFTIMKDMDIETKSLEKEYIKTLKNLIEIYAKGDFWSITLDRLIQKNASYVEQNS
ncbi:MAG: hypothetical protein LBC45_01395 [Chlamydiales bacterium]|nr:hypothetical protein [Chlamydiales bacterium]